MKILTKLDSFIHDISKENPWTNVYGVARSVLGLGTLLTLLFNDTGILFRPMAGVDDCPTCKGMAIYSIFCLFDNLEVARWVCIAILGVVISGFMPRITSIFHAWVTFSFMATAPLVDGGDQMTTVLSFLILPICLTDSRMWHWQKSSFVAHNWFDNLKVFIARSTWFMIRIQVTFVYFEACIGKFKVTEWANGTAIYYWFSNPTFGLSPEVFNFLTPLFSNSVAMVLITWSVLLLEGLLFLGITMQKRYWSYLLVAGLGFHIMIIVVHGLPTFFMAMAGALILFLRPFDEPFRLPKFIMQFKNDFVFNSHKQVIVNKTA
jgi:antimicrobial peptide system SdpB family protein